jgi:FAD/FMN-containing dehydrogenase
MTGKNGVADGKDAKPVGRSGPQSWGGVPPVRNRGEPVFWRSEIPARLARYRAAGERIVCHGMGRSYGDVCLQTAPLDRLVSFDPEHGIVRAEAGMTLDELIRFALPRGWFVPVTPGTKFVTLGGAIANDVHGKNHHRAGTFGCAVNGLELVRSTGEILWCSATSNPELFAATIGGLGLTGVISVVELRLIRVQSPYIDNLSVKFGSLDEFFALSQDSDRRFEYTVSWIDCVAKGASFGRGIFMGGNHAAGELPERVVHRRLAAVPFDAPGWLLNRYSIRAFNTAFYHKQLRPSVERLVHYDPFFYPLDAVGGWNRLYAASSSSSASSRAARR